MIAAGDNKPARKGAAGNTTTTRPVVCSGLERLTKSHTSCSTTQSADRLQDCYIMVRKRCGGKPLVAAECIVGRVDAGRPARAVADLIVIQLTARRAGHRFLVSISSW